MQGKKEAHLRSEIGEKSGAPRGTRIPVIHSNCSTEINVTQPAELTKLSKSYISQVKHGKRPPSEKLIIAILQIFGEGNTGNSVEADKAIEILLGSRQNGISPNTISFYRKYLAKAVPALGLSPTPRQLNSYIDSRRCSLGGKHAYYKAISAFCNWLYSHSSGFSLGATRNPIHLIDPPKKPNLILPSLTKAQVELLIEKAHFLRDKAIVSLFAESGLCLSELLSIKTTDIDWESRTMRVLGKGNK